MANNSTYKYEELHLRMTQEERRQLSKVAMHYKMNERQLIKALIKREAIRIS
jgi:hypothetical protein